MRDMRPLACLTFAFSLGFLPTVHAQQAEEPDSPAEATAATSATEYQGHLSTGIRRVAMRDYTRALEALQAATQLDAQRPDAYYYLGCTQRQQGDLSSAISSFERLTSTASATGDVTWQARGVQATAETLELIAITPAPGQAAGATVNREALERALAGWAELIRFADTHAQPGLGQLGRTRTMVIHRVLEQDTAYAEIRTRITEREAELAEEQREQEAQRRRGRR